MRTKITLLIVGLGLWTVPCLAVANWWSVLHCEGASWRHGSGNDPQFEAESGTSNIQCHGKPGDDGPCSGSGSGVSMSVSCQVSGTLPNGNDIQICQGSVACQNGGILSCGGRDRQVYAGARVIEGQMTGFIHCTGGGQAAESHYCTE